jgi:hypothetical protein
MAVSPRRTRSTPRKASTKKQPSASSPSPSKKSSTKKKRGQLRKSPATSPLAERRKNISSALKSAPGEEQFVAAVSWEFLYQPHTLAAIALALLAITCEFLLLLPPPTRSVNFFQL